MHFNKSLTSDDQQDLQEVTEMCIREDGARLHPECRRLAFASLPGQLQRSGIVRDKWFLSRFSLFAKAMALFFGNAALEPVIAVYRKTEQEMFVCMRLVPIARCRRDVPKMHTCRERCGTRRALVLQAYSLVPQSVPDCWLPGRAIVSSVVDAMEIDRKTAFSRSIKRAIQTQTRYADERPAAAVVAEDCAAVKKSGCLFSGAAKDLSRGIYI